MRCLSESSNCRFSPDARKWLTSNRARTLHRFANFCDKDSPRAYYKERMGCLLKRPPERFPPRADFRDRVANQSFYGWPEDSGVPKWSSRAWFRRECWAKHSYSLVNDANAKSAQLLSLASQVPIPFRAHRRFRLAHSPTAPAGACKTHPPAHDNTKGYFPSNF